MVRQVCTIVWQLFLLIILYQMGAFISKLLHLQIPGNVIGILLLLLLLWTGFLKVEQIELASALLLKHLGFFFIPISVGLMTLGNLFGLKGVYLLIILVISAIAGLIAAGKTTQRIILISKKEQKDHDYTL
ncbi:CidA/LrgA family protein [Neobacillus sp. LXY-1]|uniref:CidA/LrgA family protein n=1 Tax=Neobacillus sp. LXY-1 TaxID=3379133 RepID=UPI003EE40ABB